MSRPIEDYGFIGNMLSAALVSRDGSIDWLCLPRFDSDACFAALLGSEENGFWRIAPDGEYTTTRRYRPGTPILETVFETQDGAATLIDFMPLSDDDEHVDLFRLVRGDRGRVSLRMEFVLRFGYGQTIPWVRRADFGLTAVAGPDAVELHAPTALKSRHYRTVSEFSIGAGENSAVCALLAFLASHCRARGRRGSAAARDGGLVAPLAGPRRARQRRRQSPGARR